MGQEEEVSAAEVVVAEVQVRVRARARRTSTLSTRLPGMLIYPHSRPVSGTGPMGSLHIFAWNQAPVRGRTSSSPKPIIEVLTSSKNQTM